MRNNEEIGMIGGDRYSPAVVPVTSMHIWILSKIIVFTYEHADPRLCRLTTCQLNQFESVRLDRLSRPLPREPNFVFVYDPMLIGY